MLMNFICERPVVWVMVMAILIAVIGYFLKEECAEVAMYEEAINDLMDQYNDPDCRYTEEEIDAMVEGIDIGTEEGMRELCEILDSLR